MERGSASALTSAGVFSGFAALENSAILYDAQGRKVRETFQVGGVAQSVTQMSYDGAGRVECVAARMNLASLPTSACALGTAGSAGADRISRTNYDAADRVLTVINGLGTSVQQTTRTNAWTANGVLDWVEDANFNRSDYTYDGFDRVTRLDFPVAAVGGHAANANDNEQYGYDAAGNRVSLKLRSGETIGYSYDNLNRETLKDIPGGTANDVYSGYDLLNRRLSARFVSASGQGVVYTYDALSRVLTETETFNNRALAYQYDLAGNRTRVTYPDANYVAYTYDVLNRMATANENGTTALGTYSYDLLSRRTNLAFANGTNTSFSYSTNSQDWSLTNNLAGTTQDVVFGLSFNPARQVIARSLSNDLYAWRPTALNQAYTRNGLNQYTNVAGVNFTNDARGNMTSDGSRTLAYDLENRLLSVSGSASGTLTYDPLGRLRTFTSGGTTTTFLYSGDQLVAEYNGATLLRRYAHGAGTDTPITWYEGATLAAASRRFLHTDHQGSIVATSDNSGAATIYSYGPYGEPSSWTTPTPLSRFRYTGQIALPEIALYYYKARMYDPRWGRFLQTDPVGYEDDFNLYAYVANDPLNRSDPTGEESYLVSRPIRIADSNHMFVVVVNDETGEVEARFSYGPQRGGLFPGSLVSLTGSGTPTDVDDRDAWAAYNANSAAAEQSGISVTPVLAPDQTVIESGEAVNAALGTRDNPGPVQYAPVTGPQSTEDFANSNSAAYAVANRATQRENPQASQPLPEGTRNPGWRQHEHIPQCTGTRICNR